MHSFVYVYTYNVETKGSLQAHIKQQKIALM